MVLDIHVLDRHSGDIYVPSTVAAAGAVPGMDALQTRVRSMDAPDDQRHSPPLPSFHRPPVTPTHSRHSDTLPSFHPTPVILSGSEESSRLAIGSGDPSLRSG